MRRVRPTVKPKMWIIVEFRDSASRRVVPLDGPLKEQTRGVRILRITLIRRIAPPRGGRRAPRARMNTCCTTSGCFKRSRGKSNAVGVLFSKDRSRSLSMERMPNQVRSVSSGRSVKSVIPLVLFFLWLDWPRGRGTKPFPEFCEEPKFGMKPPCTPDRLLVIGAPGRE